VEALMAILTVAADAEDLWPATGELPRYGDVEMQRGARILAARVHDRRLRHDDLCGLAIAPVCRAAPIGLGQSTP
jgi:hypothetical protein